jgi:dihydroorotate dehydrogenase
MSWLYRTLVRPALFRLDPETAHERALAAARAAGASRFARAALEQCCAARDPRLQSTLLGLTFPNPVGLAAGFDKNAVGLAAWPALGFGFVEIGTVTARAQPGNDPPRMFRLPDQQALVNRLGFNNDGATTIAARLPPPPHAVPLGVNIGKSRAAPLERAAEDYLAALRPFLGRADFIVINVSSPNTPGLRQLQDRAPLDELLAAVMGCVRAETARASSAPVLLKLAPDLAFEQIDDALELARQHGVAGIVATNTTVQHPTPPEGGLSGAPLRARSTACIRHIHRQSRGALPIIGVGGVFSAEHAWEKIRAGASLVEVWTGLVYEGPFIARHINRGLVRRLERAGLDHIGQAVGADA